MMDLMCVESAEDLDDYVSGKTHLSFISSAQDLVDLRYFTTDFNDNESFFYANPTEFEEFDNGEYTGCEIAHFDVMPTKEGSQDEETQKIVSSRHEVHELDAVVPLNQSDASMHALYEGCEHWLSTDSSQEEQHKLQVVPVFDTETESEQLESSDDEDDDYVVFSQNSVESSHYSDDENRDLDSCENQDQFVPNLSIEE